MSYSHILNIFTAAKGRFSNAVYIISKILTKIKDILKKINKLSKYA